MALNMLSAPQGATIVCPKGFVMLRQGQCICPEWYGRCRSPSAGDCVLAGDSGASLPSITAWLVTLDITRLGTDSDTGSEAAEHIPAAMHGRVIFGKPVCG